MKGNSVSTIAEYRENTLIHLPNESELLEVISQADSSSALFSAAFHALDDAIGAVMQNLFYKNGEAVKYIVDPLMTSQGPLADLKVRAGLLLGLGFFEREIYNDLESFVRLKEYGEIHGEGLSFTDSYVLNELRSIAAIKRSMPIEFDPSMIDGLSETMMRMFIERHNQKVQSTVVLAITDLVERLRYSRRC